MVAMRSSDCRVTHENLFRISYSNPERLWRREPPLLFVEAAHGAVMLASAIGTSPDATSEIVVNERTTVATANAFAQFVAGQKIAGDAYGMINALRMAANDSVTKIPFGDPNRAFNISLGSPSGSRQIKPFSIAFDLRGEARVTDNLASTVTVIAPEGAVIDTMPGIYNWKTVLRRPLGDAADSQRNIWVSNSDWLDGPCPNGYRKAGPAANPSITLYLADRRAPYPGSPFAGGGLTIPWRIAVDGNDTVWVFNFGAVPVPQTPQIPTGVSHFCGIDTKKCPAGLQFGDPISPSTGYRSDTLTRITGGQIDPSGNLWLMNNWKLNANPFLNPGGNSIVIVIGVAAPIRTPLIGPPESFAPRRIEVNEGASRSEIGGPCGKHVHR
jgi:hypothetical protein